MKKLYLAPLFLAFIISGCQSNITTDYEPESGDILDKHGDITNLDKFNAFVDHVQQGKKDKIRIVHYTIEGDAILHDLDFDGKTIHSTFDSTRDEYGSGSVTKASCKSIAVQETNTSTEYVIEGCDNNEREFIFLTVEKN
jgi:hypothetical protein